MTDAFDQLTPLELRCLALAALGRTRHDIMLETDIPINRIDGALAEATRKLKAGNLAEAICRAVRLKLIHSIQ